MDFHKEGTQSGVLLLRKHTAPPPFPREGRMIERQEIKMARIF